MKEEYLYSYNKSRKQRSKLFIRMGIASLFYIAVLYVVESFTKVNISNHLHIIILGILVLTAVILFYIAWWHIKNPATYKVTITSKELSISYPEVSSWGFCVNVFDIEKIENRQTHSGGGRSIINTGVVMKNGDFHEISMNYGNSINKMFKVLKSINPSITFPKMVKTSFYLFGNKVK